MFFSDVLHLSKQGVLSHLLDVTNCALLTNDITRLCHVGRTFRADLYV